MTFKTFPIWDARVAEYLTQAGVQQKREHKTMTLLHVADDSKVEEQCSPNFRKYKKITTSNGMSFELEYFRADETAFGRLVLKIPALQEG